MTATRLIEYNIERQLLQRRSQQAECPDAGGSPSSVFDLQAWVDRSIGVLALTACLVVVGSYAQELLWVVLAAATAVALRD